MVTHDSDFAISKFAEDSEVENRLTLIALKDKVIIYSMRFSEIRT
jgi:hypothetical protein